MDDMDDTTVVKRPDENRDPITGTPGAHPVGTGIGAAAGGIAAGAAAGTLAAGPIGTAIGAVVGAVAGGLAGKAIAERIDPTVVDEYWESRFDQEPYYEAGMTFDDYSPGYRLGADARTQYADRSFEDMEPALADDYESVRGTSRLSWDEAKRPVRAGWEAKYL